MFGILKIFADKFFWWGINIFGYSLVAIVILKFGDIWEFFWNYIKSLLSSYDFSSFSILLQWSGLLGWIANCLKLPECFQIIMSGYFLKFTLRKIPFLKW